MFDKNRLETLIQFALLRAGEEDDMFRRSLGPIHIIKYAYLADLYYAEKHGETYTGIDWTFFNFGPWSSDAFHAIDGSLAKIMARKECLDSIYQEEAIRWNLRDSDRLTTISREVPSSISYKLSRDIHKYSNDTRALLDFVYKTQPMLTAAPNKLLTFSSTPKAISTPDSLTRLDSLSNKKKKGLKSKLQALNSINQTRTKRKQLINPVNNPRFDDVYDYGLKWLNEIESEGDYIKGDVLVEFADSVWESDIRKNYDVS